jgi:ethanolamine utilization protein EutA (predicted chaperonin)
LSVEAASRRDPALVSALARERWKVENVELVTVGIDIGSSTSHVMFARVHLEREAQSLSSRFAVVERTVLWRSPIVLTPYLDRATIDARALGGFVSRCYREVGLEAGDVDSGAVILTGEAMKRRNAQALAELFADESGTFVCASAGHHLECTLAAHGSGAVELSAASAGPLLHVDVGGGTSKLALLHHGTILDTAAIAVGGRLVAFEEEVLTRVEEPATIVAEHLGVELAPGERVPAALRTAFVEAQADALVELATGAARSPLATSLLVTEPPRWPVAPTAISMSGGVAEYVYGREQATFGDLASELASAIVERLRDGRLALPLVEPPQGIRATVIGASQFSVQVSGNTVNVSDPAVLPKRGVPVLYPRVDLGASIEPHLVAEAIVDAARRMDLLGRAADAALGFAWDGDPSHARLRGLAEGILSGSERSGGFGDALIVLMEGDVARSLGHLLREELSARTPIVCLDGLELREFDYVDIGRVIEPTGVVPVVIKSLLFGAQDGRERRLHGLRR